MKGWFIALVGSAAMTASSFAQNQAQPVWGDRYNSPANSSDLAGAICADDLGNVYVGGSTPTEIDSSFAVIKYGPSGARQWTARHIGPNGKVQAVAVDASRNVFAGGYRLLGQDILDHVVVKFRPQGNELWTRNTNGLIRKVLADPHGNVYVVGLNQLGAHPDWSTMKFSPSGDLLWEIRYDGPLGLDDRPSNAMFDASGNLVVAGIIDNDEADAPSDVSIAKYSPEGVVLWQRSFTDAPTTHERVNDFGIDATGAITVIGGTAATGETYETIFPLWLKYAPDGALLASRVRGGGEFGQSCAVDAGGNLYTATRTHLVKYSPQRTVVWQGGFPSEIFGSAIFVQISPSGEIVVAGDTWGTNTIDYQIYAFSAAGVMRWQHCYDGPIHGTDNLEGMCIAPSGRVTVTGTSFNGATQSGGTADDIVTLAFGKEATTALPPP